jgi:hypothetical protein
VSVFNWSEGLVEEFCPWSVHLNSETDLTSTVIRPPKPGFQASALSTSFLVWCASWLCLKQPLLHGNDLSRWHSSLSVFKCSNIPCWIHPLVNWHCNETQIIDKIKIWLKLKSLCINADKPLIGVHRKKALYQCSLDSFSPHQFGTLFLLIADCILPSMVVDFHVLDVLMIR